MSSDLQSKKSSLEQELKESIAKFENDTGLEVTEIVLNRTRTTGGSHLKLTIKTEIKS